MDVTGKHYAWFQNRECEYFPCHKGVLEEEFNCLFCYCPLYRAPNCRGSFVMRNGIKDCSYCLLPHNGLEGYAYILAQLRAEGLFDKKKPQEAPRETEEKNPPSET